MDTIDGTWRFVRAMARETTPGHVGCTQTLEHSMNDLFGSRSEKPGPKQPAKPPSAAAKADADKRLPLPVRDDSDYSAKDIEVMTPETQGPRPMMGKAWDVPGGQKGEYSGYTGTYTYDGKQLVTTVDAAPDPSRIGTRQPRGCGSKMD